MFGYLLFGGGETSPNLHSLYVSIELFFKCQVGGGVCHHATYHSKTPTVGTCEELLPWKFPKKVPIVSWINLRVQ